MLSQLVLFLPGRAGAGGVRGLQRQEVKSPGPQPLLPGLPTLFQLSLPLAESEIQVGGPSQCSRPPHPHHLCTQHESIKSLAQSCFQLRLVGVLRVTG